LSAVLVDGLSAVSIGSVADVDGKSCGGRVDNGVKGADGRRFGGRPRFVVSVVGVDGPASFSIMGGEHKKNKFYKIYT
jgi:hypothetical protein